MDQKGVEGLAYNAGAVFRVVRWLSEFRRVSISDALCGLREEPLAGTVTFLDHGAKNQHLSVRLNARNAEPLH